MNCRHVFIFMGVLPLLLLLAAGCPAAPTIPASEPDPYQFADFWPMAIGNHWTFAKKSTIGNFAHYTNVSRYRVVGHETVNGFDVWHLMFDDLANNTSTALYLTDANAIVYLTDTLSAFANLPTVDAHATALQPDAYPKTANALSPISNTVQDFDLSYSTGRISDLGPYIFLGATVDDDIPYGLNDFPISADNWVVWAHDDEFRQINGQTVDVIYTRCVFAWGIGPLFDAVYSREAGPVDGHVLREAVVNGVHY